MFAVFMCILRLFFDTTKGHNGQEVTVAYLPWAHIVGLSCKHNHGHYKLLLIVVL